MKLAGIIFIIALTSCKLGNQPKEQQEPNQRLHDIWAVTEIKGNPIHQSPNPPRLEIFLKDQKILGFDGCSDYQAAIEDITDTKLVFGPLVSTYKLCEDMSISDSFQDAMKDVAAYQLDGLKLMLANEKKEQVITLKKVD